MAAKNHHSCTFFSFPSLQTEVALVLRFCMTFFLSPAGELLVIIDKKTHCAGDVYRGRIEQREKKRGAAQRKTTLASPGAKHPPFATAGSHQSGLMPAAPSFGKSSCTAPSRLPKASPPQWRPSSCGSTVHQSDAAPSPTRPPVCQSERGGRERERERTEIRLAGFWIM